MMNRPNINDYETKAILGDQELKVKVDLSNFGYLKDLERYCDELEKALEKACGLIQWEIPCPKEYLDYKLKCCNKKVCEERKYDTTDCWKEWALSDDE